MSERAAIYCRLSEEDKNKANASDDSGSIQNQKAMLREYAERMGWEIYDIYSDDDYAGSDRNRPQFNRLLADAQAGKFSIILCKTQSRFTRELELVEKYQPQYLIHGHVHLTYGTDRTRDRHLGSTQVINASERYVLDLPDREVPLKQKNQLIWKTRHKEP